MRHHHHHHHIRLLYATNDRNMLVNAAVTLSSWYKSSELPRECLDGRRKETPKLGSARPCDGGAADS